MPRRLLVSLCLAFFIHISAHALELRVEQAMNDIALLAEQGIIGNADYWQASIAPDGKCDGAKVATLLVKGASMFRKVKTTEEAIQVMVERGVLSSPDYWLKNAVPGGNCVPSNVAAMMNHLVGRLPAPKVAPLTAAPLEATAIENLKDAYDVVIAGAGTGGTGAAIQAARMGCSVLLLEETDWIGGQMNAAAVTSMDEGVTLCRERGLYRELVGQIAAHYQPLGINHETACGMRHVCVEPRVGRNILHVMLGDARGRGVLDLALRARVAKVSKQGDLVTGVEIEQTGGKPRSIASRILIDATEWGDVLPLAGARYRVGNCTSDAIDLTKHVQDNTWTAVVKQYPNGVPPELLINEPPPGYTDKLHAMFLRSLVAGDQPNTQAKPWNFGTFIGYRGMPDSSRPGDAPPITRTHLNYNNDYPATVAEIENPAQRQIANRAMRLKTLHLLYYIQHTLGKTDWSVANDEGYDTPYNRAEIDAWLRDQPELSPYKSILYHFSVMPYTRESRRIIGLHTLTASEIERKPGHPVLFPNTIALGDYAVDLHGSKVPEYLELDLDPEKDIPRGKFGDRGIGPFPIPFESLIPEKLDGFLPAEKNYSQSRLANGATRLQPHTLLVGQAVGAIAALSIRQHVQPRQLDPLVVQLTLLDAGDTLYMTPLMDVRQKDPHWKAVQLVLTRSLLTETKGKFAPHGKLSDEDRNKLITKVPGIAHSLPEGITRVETAETVMKALVEKVGKP